MFFFADDISQFELMAQSAQNTQSAKSAQSAQCAQSAQSAQNESESCSWQVVKRIQVVNESESSM